MIQTSTRELSVNEYWGLIKSAPSDIKLRLITKLSESLQIKENKRKSIRSKKLLLEKVAGSWTGPESPEQLIDQIREHRTSKPPVSF